MTHFCHTYIDIKCTKLHWSVLTLSNDVREVLQLSKVFCKHQLFLEKRFTSFLSN